MSRSYTKRKVTNRSNKWKQSFVGHDQGKQMATKVYKFFGKCKWAKVQPDQLDLNYDKETKSWRLDLYMTDGSWSVFNDSGLSLKVREDKEDGNYVSFRRQEKSIFTDEIKENGPPYVVDTEGNLIETKVGNGSKVCAEVEVYDTRKGKGHRLIGITVYDLVPFEDTKPTIGEEVPW